MKYRTVAVQYFFFFIKYNLSKAIMLIIGLEKNLRKHLMSKHVLIQDLHSHLLVQRGRYFKRHDVPFGYHHFFLYFSVIYPSNSINDTHLFPVIPSGSYAQLVSIKIVARIVFARPNSYNYLFSNNMFSKISIRRTKRAILATLPT